MNHIARIALALFISITAANAADDDVMTTRYGNTTIATDAKGVVTKTYYNADHTFTSRVGTQTLKGTWKVANGSVCRTYVVPPEGSANPVCRAVEQSRKIGETWVVGTGADRISVVLVKGIQ